MQQKGLLWLVGIWLWLSAASAMATGVFESVTGQVRATVGSAPPITVSNGQQISPGATVTTGPNSHVILRFDDGQVVVLNQDTEFQVVDYVYNKTQPKASSIVLNLLKGALRAVTGLLAKENPQAFQLRTPVATIGIRGTDFKAATGSLYLAVTQGLVSATSSVGTVTFAAGQIGFVSAAGVLPAAITAAQLPASVAASFSQLGTIAVPGAAGAGAGAGGSAGGAAGGAGAGGAAAAGAAGIPAGAIAAGAVAAGAAAAAGAGGGGTTTTHH